MPYICKDCENKNNFTRIADGTCNYTDYQNINEEGDVNDSETEHEDYDVSEYRDYECKNCGSNNVEDVSQEEWDAWTGPVTTWKERFK